MKKLAACAIVLALHAILLAVAPLAPASLSFVAALVLVRLVALLIVPGAALASITLTVAELVRQREGSSSGAGISVGAGRGTSIGPRGTK